MCDLPFTIEHRGEHAIDRHSAIVRGAHGHVLAHRRSLGRVPYPLPDTVLLLAVVQPPAALPELSPQDLLPAQPADLKCGLADFEERPVAVEHRHEDRHVVDEPAQLRFTFP